MFLSRRNWPVALLAAPLALCLMAGFASAQTFDEQLEQCKAVTTPAALTTCAPTQDPLNGGGATISDEGDVTVTVFGAATNTTYTITFVSNNGTQTTSIGSLKTGVLGNGAFRKEAMFKFGTVGAGNVVLTGPSGEEFVTGLSVSSDGIENGRDFQPGLVRCTDVVVPGTLSNCGSDSLSSGRVDLENDDGALQIHISGARPSTTYTVMLVSPTGTSTPLSTIGPTNKAGGATLVLDPALPPSTIAAGEVVLQNSSGLNEFVSGFKVNEKFVAPKVSASQLVPCGSVTDPVLSTCGSDPLDSGSYQVQASGEVTVILNGALPSTNYELFFRPLDDSGDMDTNIAVPTNSLGNAKASGKPSFLSSGTIASGTFVVKEQGSDSLDQFVAGFDIH
jgi:hypothetical protein